MDYLLFAVVRCPGGPAADRGGFVSSPRLTPSRTVLPSSWSRPFA